MFVCCVVASIGVGVRLCDCVRARACPALIPTVSVLSSRSSQTHSALLLLFYLFPCSVDYLKVDDMSGQPHTETVAYDDYARIRDALNKTGRPIFFSTCGHSGAEDPSHPNSFFWAGEKCGELANACRIAADVRQWGAGQFGTNKVSGIVCLPPGMCSVLHRLATVVVRALTGRPHPPPAFRRL